MNKYPNISCFCSIYGKVHCLPELVYSFLNQNYPGKKELIILNDLSQQTIVFDHPEVRVINLSHKIKPLGAKFNKNIEYCNYDIVSIFEVDDIYLSNHLTYAMDNFKNEIFHSDRGFFFHYNDNKLKYTGNYFHATHVFSKSLFYKVGQYSLDIDNTTIDIDLISKFKNIVGNYSHSPQPKDATYIYKWGVGGYHTSGWGNVESASDLAETSVLDRISHNLEPTGIINISPNWKFNYEKLKEDCL